MNDLYPYILALHIIFIVTWFSGLFYIVRLFIYHTEALQKNEPEKTILASQFSIMEKRLMNIITTPSMILVLATGITLLSIQPGFLQEAWMQAKLFFVLCVVVYHFICLHIMRKLKTGIIYPSQRLRLFNELATLLLVSIVFLVVVKNLLNMVWALLAFFTLALLLMLAVRLYRRNRSRK